MSHRKIGVGLLFVGRSAEHEVSRASAANVLRALDPDRYEVFLIGIAKDGRWLACNAGNGAGTGAAARFRRSAAARQWSPAGEAALRCDGSDAAAATLQHSRVDVVFPILHGPNGEATAPCRRARDIGRPLCGLGRRGFGPQPWTRMWPSAYDA